VGILLFPSGGDAAEASLTTAPGGDLLRLVMPVALMAFYFVPHLLPDSLPARLLLTFAGMSPTLFGGGLIMIPLLQGLVVDEMHWLSPAAFAAISASQMTPGPIVSSVIFAGFIVAGWMGALMAAIGIFAPTAVMTIGAVHLADRIKRLAWLRRFMRGVRAAVVGLIVAAALLLLHQGGLRPMALAILPLAWLGLTRYQLAPYWLIAAGGAAALLLHALPGGNVLLHPVASLR
jgi:chromate transporter